MEVDSQTGQGIGQNASPNKKPPSGRTNNAGQRDQKGESGVPTTQQTMSSGISRLDASGLTSIPPGTGDEGALYSAYGNSTLNDRA